MVNMITALCDYFSGTFVCDTGGTFNSDTPGTFVSDIGGTFEVILSTFHRLSFTFREISFTLGFIGPIILHFRGVLFAGMKSISYLYIFN